MTFADIPLTNRQTNRRNEKTKALPTSVAEAIKTKIYTHHVHQNSDTVTMIHSVEKKMILGLDTALLKG